MSDGTVPGEWQQDPAGPQQGFGGQPADPGQTWPAGGYGTGPTPPPGYGQQVMPGYGQQVTPGYGQQVTPGYGQPGSAVPGYGPPGYGYGMYGAPPPTYLTWARIAMVGGVLFNLILGLPTAIVAQRYGQTVRQQWATGNQQAAVTASRKARTWAIVSTVFDVLGIVLVIVLISQSASSKGTFSNPATVAASIKVQLQKRISDPSSHFYRPGLKVTSVTCRPNGPHTDLCVDHFSNGQTATEVAVISADGQSYHTR